MMDVKWICLIPAIIVFVMTMQSSCSSLHREKQVLVDSLNYRSYEFHYRNLDSTLFYADKAYDLSGGYGAGRAEALNNKAFVAIAKMEYVLAHELLDEASSTSGDQIEMLVSDVLSMRLCQRESHNKDFYMFRQRALSRMSRIAEDRGSLTDRQRRRLLYGWSEFLFVASAYYYYVGLTDLSAKAILDIPPDGDIVKDDTQLLNYYYNVGSGGVLSAGKEKDVAMKEFLCLVRCYLLAKQGGYVYWEANALQAMSEHLQDSVVRKRILAEAPQEVEYVNADRMPLNLLAGNLAQRSLELFRRYGDVYQTAGAYRTLAECYWGIGDYRSALICLKDALGSNKAVGKAPDLVASIREQLSIVYSALDNKSISDYNRNIYLDMQEITRQDRQLEARAEQLDRSSMQLNVMIAAVVVMIVAVVVLLFVFDYMRRKGSRFTQVSILKPLHVWEEAEKAEEVREKERIAAMEEQTEIEKRKLQNNRFRNIEQRAKVAIVTSVIPLINRMAHETDRLVGTQEAEDIRNMRYKYIIELTDKINEYNGVLTKWIQMRRGELSLHIETFSIQKLFNIIARSRTEFGAKGVELEICPTNDIVKADRILTLFMINTMVDNARKFTPPGGHVSVKSVSADNYVEISVTDNGVGMEPEKVNTIFKRSVIRDETDSASGATTSDSSSHGFGLMNCKGIIEKYKKTSSFFSVCSIGVTSDVGKGSRFFFRLPKGVARVVMLAVCLAGYGRVTAADYLTTAGVYADSAYFSNISGHYRRTVCYADSCIAFLNKHIQSVAMKNGTKPRRMSLNDPGDGSAAELSWFNNRLKTDYNVILDIRNECAVAALALHDWKLYSYNNKIYTQLFRERSADSSLPEYVKIMQKSETNKNVAIVMLVGLLVSIFPAYYFLYFRYRHYNKQCLQRLYEINVILGNGGDPSQMLSQINKVWKNGDGGELVRTAETEPLFEIVRNIKTVLEQAAARRKDMASEMETMKEQLRKAEFDNEKVYISNNILDNCLSALKHETMYYPSRIRQVVSGNGRNIAAAKELVEYYKDLYTLLSEQAMRQTETGNVIDYETVSCLWDILKKTNGGTIDSWKAEDAGNGYVKIELQLSNVCLSERQCAELFSPLTCDVRFLLCKQIIREAGEMTGARRCGIQAFVEKEQGTKIEIVFTNRIWKNSMSSL